jgi:hypothetical protein
MEDFDILSLLAFDPPGFLCKNCLNIFGLQTSKFFEQSNDLLKETWLECPTCKFKVYDTQELLDIHHEDIMGQARRLADIGKAMHYSLRDGKVPPMRVLLATLLNADSFVHFTTLGINHILLGALKVISQKVNVNGIIVNPAESVIEELKEHQDETPRMNLIIRQSSGYSDSEETPHTKLIIIDGLLAFAGSANFTLAGWRKARKQYEYVQVITEIGKIQDLHNRHFSSIWYKLNKSSIDPTKEIPF